jgi:hypothetical protein
VYTQTIFFCSLSLTAPLHHTRKIRGLPASPCALAPAAVAAPSVSVVANLIRTLATVRPACLCGTWTLRISAGTCPFAARTSSRNLYRRSLERIIRFDTTGPQR